MIFLLLCHVVIGAFAALLAWFGMGGVAGLSVLVGGLTMLGNLIVLCLVWPLLLEKKLVALSIGVIVFKFAILIWIISLVATSSRLQPAWFGLGLATVVLSALATAVRYRET